METHILNILFRKTEFEIETSINSESSIANIDIAFKDICVVLRSSEDIFDSEMSINGYCEVSVTNEDIFGYEIRKLTGKQIFERVEFYEKNLLANERFIEGTDVYKDIAMYRLRLHEILTDLQTDLTKQQILSRYGREIEFYNNQLFYKLLPSNHVEIKQTGFSFDEFKNMMKTVRLQVNKNYSFIYNIDFESLTFN